MGEFKCSRNRYRACGDMGVEQGNWKGLSMTIEHPLNIQTQTCECHLCAPKRDVATRTIAIESDETELATFLRNLFRNGAKFRAHQAGILTELEMKG